MARTNYDSEKVIKLLEIAMNGRSAKAYSEATGINPAIISRIKNGDYKPGKKILGQIAQESNGVVSLDDLMEAAGYSEKDIDEAKTKALANIIGSMAGTGSALIGVNAISKAIITTAGGVGGVGLVPVIAPAITASVAMYNLLKRTNRIQNDESTLSDEKEEEEIENIKTNQRRFKAMSMGVLYQSLISRAVSCKSLEMEKIEGLDLFLKESLLIDDIKSNIKRLDLYFMHYEGLIFDEVALSKEDLAVALLSKFAFDEPNENKQIDIITDDKNYYEALTRFIHKTSIKANIVALLMDVENTEIVSEEVITTYSEREDGLFYFIEPD